MDPPIYPRYRRHRKTSISATMIPALSQDSSVNVNVIIPTTADQLLDISPDILPFQPTLSPQIQARSEGMTRPQTDRNHEELVDPAGLEERADTAQPRGRENTDLKGSFTTNFPARSTYCSPVFLSFPSLSSLRISTCQQVSCVSRREAVPCHFTSALPVLEAASSFSVPPPSGPDWLPPDSRRQGCTVLCWTQFCTHFLKRHSTKLKYKWDFSMHLQYNPAIFMDHH